MLRLLQFSDLEADESVDTPGSVLARGCPQVREWRPSLYDVRCRTPPAAYPGARASSPRTLPVLPCSGWGLPSRTGRPARWWSLTPPFHPYLLGRGQEGGLFSV